MWHITEGLYVKIGYNSVAICHLSVLAYITLAYLYGWMFNDNVPSSSTCFLPLMVRGDANLILSHVIWGGINKSPTCSHQFQSWYKFLQHIHNTHHETICSSGPLLIYMTVCTYSKTYTGSCKQLCSWAWWRPSPEPPPALHSLHNQTNYTVQCNVGTTGAKIKTFSLHKTCQLYKFMFHVY